jgi:hypothetical protein
MTHVFVAGSRAVSRLSSQVRERLDNIMKQDFIVLVGDASGADKAVQRYLAKCRYGKVVVYCMEVCRNNVGGWPTRTHSAEPGSKRDRHYYGIKDLAMVKDASCGFMLWDGVSKGTLANVVNLLNLRKKVLLYLSPKKLFFKLGAFEDLDQALHANGIDNVPAFLTSLGMPQPLSQDLRLATFT